MTYIVALIDSESLLRHHTEGSAGLDITTNESFSLEPHETKLVRTGIKIAIPKGKVGMIVPRSSLGLTGVTIPNSPGIIDEDYRGEVKVILFNSSDETRVFSDGDRIAQLVLIGYDKVILSPVTKSVWKNHYSNTKRGEGGFGSTGK